MKPWPEVSLGELLRLDRRKVKVEPEQLYQGDRRIGPGNCHWMTVREQLQAIYSICDQMRCFGDRRRSKYAARV